MDQWEKVVVLKIFPPKSGISHYSQKYKSNVESWNLNFTVTKNEGCVRN